jgi:hypothetical protein
VRLFGGKKFQCFKKDKLKIESSCRPQS